MRPIITGLLPPVILGLGLSACAKETEGLGPGDPPPQTPPPPRGCALELPASLEFGTQPGGSSAAHHLELSSLDRCDPELSLEDPEDAFEAERTDLNLELRFTPRRPGPHRALLHFAGQTIELLGEGVLPKLSAVPELLDLGTTPLGCASAPATLQLVNEEEVPIAIDGLRSQASDFMVSHPSTQVLEAGERLMVSVIFEPSTELRADAPLMVDIRGFEASLSVAELRGQGSLVSSAVADEFLQPSAPMTDVLFVVGTGPGMEPVQARLQQNIADLFVAYRTCGHDVRYGVTDADLQGLGGQLVAPGAIDPNAPNALAQLEQAVLLGAAGSEAQAPLEAAFRALADFRRPQANLEVHIITHVEDRSPESPQTYAQRFSALGAPDFAVVSSVAGEVPNGCTSDEIQAEAASRLWNVTMATRGVFRSVCRNSWWLIIDENPVCAGLLVAFPLSERPLASTVRVWVDGIELPPQRESGTVNWAYEETSNEVRFSPFGIPGWNAEVRIEYQTPICP